MLQRLIQRVYATLPAGHFGDSDCRSAKMKTLAALMGPLSSPHHTPPTGLAATPISLLCHCTVALLREA